MLQQTRIETVLPYYGRFLKAFPSLLRLARAPSRRCSNSGREWGIMRGLATCMRRKNHQAGSERENSRHEGSPPDLAGFGPYTAGAVASIALIRGLPLRTAMSSGSESPGQRSGLGASLERKSSWNSIWKTSFRKGSFGIHQALMDLARWCASLSGQNALCPVRRFCPFTTEEKRRDPPERRRGRNLGDRPD